MTRIVPLTAELLAGAVIESGDPWAAELAATPGYLASMMAEPAACEAMLRDGRVLGAAGVAPQWVGRAVAWLLRSPECGRADGVRLLLRAARRLAALEQDPRFRRVEMYVCAEEPWCDRFGAAMGMRAEGDLRAWDPAGRTFRLFARVAGEG